MTSNWADAADGRDPFKRSRAVLPALSASATTLAAGLLGDGTILIALLVVAVVATASLLLVVGSEERTRRLGWLISIVRNPQLLGGSRLPGIGGAPAPADEPDGDDPGGWGLP